MKRATILANLILQRVGKTQDLKAMLEVGMSVNLTDHKGNTL